MYSYEVLFFWIRYVLPEATVLGPVTEGVVFLGMRNFPGCLRFQAQRVRRMRKALALEPDGASVEAHMALLRVWGMPDLAKRETAVYGG